MRSPEGAFGVRPKPSADTDQLGDKGSLQPWAARLAVTRLREFPPGADRLPSEILATFRIDLNH